MSIQITCPECQKRYSVPDDMAGQTGACACGATFAIPAPSPRPPLRFPSTAHVASVQRIAANHWPTIKRQALPALKLALARPWLPAPLAAWLLSFLLISFHNRLYLSSRWPPNVLLLVLDGWIYAGIATLAVVVSRRLSPRPISAGAGLLAGYAIGLLVLVMHGLSLSSPALHWLSPWHNYPALRHFTAFLVGATVGEAAVWVPYLLAHPPAMPAAVKPTLDILRPCMRQLQAAGLVAAWLAPTALTIRLYTHFRALPVKPWAHASQAPAYWLTLLLMPALFALWTLWRWEKDRRIAGAPLLGFVGVQLGLLGALIVWPYPSWQRETAIALSAFFGLIGVGLASVAIPQSPGLISRRAHRATSLALATLGVALATVIVGLLVSPALQAMVWRQAAATMNLPQYAVTRLAAVHGPDAVPVLINTLGEERLPVASAAEKALAHLDPPMVRALAAMLPGATLRQRCWAAYFLGESKQREAVTPLLAMLRNELPPPARDIELEEQQALSYSSTYPTDLQRTAQARHDRELARYHNPPVRSTAMPPKYRFYSYTPEALRAAAVIALAKIDDPQVAPALAAVLDDPSTWLRCQALTALATLQYRPAIPAMRRILVEGRVDERALAADALTQMGDREIFQPLISLLAVDDSRAMAAAARGLAQIGDKRALTPLAAALVRGSNDSGSLDVLLKAYQSLGGDTLEPLLAAAQSLEPWMRDFAANKLGDQHPAEAVAYFSKLLADPQRGEQAAQVMRRLGTDEAKAALRAHGWPEDW